MKLRNEYILELSKLNSTKSIVYIFFEWILIASLVILYISLNNFLLLFILIPIIATRQYALYSLLHEGVHFLILKNKRWNDFVTKLFLSLPLFISLEIMRKAHFEHHKHLQTSKDPEINHLNYSEFQFPMRRTKLITIIFKDICGFNFVKYRFLKIIKLNKQTILPSLKSIATLDSLFYTIILIVAVYTGFWSELILLWIIPYITFYQALNRLRTYTEHFNIPNESFNTRSLVINDFLGFFICPYNLGFHSAHHLFPYIPNYNLRKLHNTLNLKDDNAIYVESNIGLMLKRIVSD